MGGGSHICNDRGFIAGWGAVLTYVMTAAASPINRTCEAAIVVFLAEGSCGDGRSKKNLWNGVPSTTLPFVSGSMHVTDFSVRLLYVV